MTKGTINGEANQRHWANITEAGSLWGLRFLLGIYRLFGRGFYAIVLYPVATYFALCRSEARRASQRFLARHYASYPQHWNKKPSLLDTIKHFHHFAMAILDKGIAWMETINKNEFDVLTPNSVEAIINNPRGQLIIGSHFGNLEFTRGFIQSRFDKVINVLLYDQHAKNFVSLMNKISPQSRVNVYQVTEVDIATTLALKEKIKAGEWVFIAGDRVPVTGQKHTADVQFLGEQAPLPIGPYMFAKAMECEVKLMFAYRHRNKICFECVDFAEKIDIPRKERKQTLQHYAQRYATELESRCKEAPMQWFNFYDFWERTNNDR